MLLYEIIHRYLKNDYQFFYTLKTKDRTIKGNCNLLIKVKLHKLELSSPLSNLSTIIPTQKTAYIILVASIFSFFCSNLKNQKNWHE